MNQLRLLGLAALLASASVERFVSSAAAVKRREEEDGANALSQIERADAWAGSSTNAPALTLPSDRSFRRNRKCDIKRRLARAS